MSISIIPMTTDHYVYIKCEGSYKFESMCETYARAFTFAAAAERGALILDARGLGGEPPNFLERFKLGVRIAEIQRGTGIMVAGVGDEGMVSPNRFGEIVARNRSAYARVFTEIEAAIEWVREELGILVPPDRTPSPG